MNVVSVPKAKNNVELLGEQEILLTANQVVIAPLHAFLARLIGQMLCLAFPLESFFALILKRSIAVQSSENIARHDQQHSLVTMHFDELSLPFANEHLKRGMNFLSLLKLENNGEFLGTIHDYGKPLEQEITKPIYEEQTHVIYYRSRTSSDGRLTVDIFSR